MDRMDLMIRAALIGLASGGALLTAAFAAQGITDDERAVMDADARVIAAAEQGDRTALDELTDADFTWVGTPGVLRAKDSILNDIPQPLLGLRSGAAAEARSYGPKLIVVQHHGTTEGPAHAMHVWVKRAAGWRLLHIIELVEGPRRVYGGTSVNAPDCINPCQRVPFIPSTAVERAVIEAWQAQASSPEGWRRHVADDNVGRTSNGSYTKADRWAVISQQVRDGVSVTANPMQWARMWELPEAVFMLAMQPRHNGKPFWVSRVFVNRGGTWQMAESYQATIQDAAPF